MPDFDVSVVIRIRCVESGLTAQDDVLASLDGLYPTRDIRCVSIAPCEPTSAQLERMSATDGESYTERAEQQAAIQRDRR